MDTRIITADDIIRAGACAPAVYDFLLKNHKRIAAAMPASRVLNLVDADDEGYVIRAANLYGERGRGAEGGYDDFNSLNNLGDSGCGYYGGGGSNGGGYGGGCYGVDGGGGGGYDGSTNGGGGRGFGHGDYGSLGGDGNGCGAGRYGNNHDDPEF